MSSSSNNGDGNFGEDFPQQQSSNHPNAITAFVSKLWALVNDSSWDDLIAWDPSGNSFHVYDQSRFARETLPCYFKHNNFASFIRQLNMYGFRKLSNIEHGSLKNERDDIEFTHPFFVRGQYSLLENIKRRAPDNQQKSNVSQPIKSELPRPSTSTNTVLTNPNFETKSVRTSEFGHLLEDVRTLQSKQTSLTDKLFHLEDENQALWREIGSLRQKHNKQQQIVSKLMEFLLHILTSSSQTHRRSVEQNLSSQSGKESTSHSGVNLDSITGHGLKRKPAAIMLGEETSKRQNTQQGPLRINPPMMINLQSSSLLQPSITINELTDNDLATWNPSTNESPLVDLVPSPPPSSSSSAGFPMNRPNEEPFTTTTNYEWIVPTDDLTSSLPFPSLSNNNDQNESFPDFLLTPDQDPLNATSGSILSGINTSHSNPTKVLSTMKEQSAGRSNVFQSLLAEPMKSNIDSNSSNNVGFSLDEFTGHVDNIQTSLDNIREFMFNKLPDGSMIEDLFDDENVLLSPLLPSSSNLLNESIADPKGSHSYDYQSESSNGAEILPATNSVVPPAMISKEQLNSVNNDSTSSCSMPQVSNQLLEQLIHQNKTIEHQQQNQIKQLESENLKLQARLNVLDQQGKK